METIQPFEIKVSAFMRLNMSLRDPPLDQYLRISQRLENCPGWCLEMVGLLDDQMKPTPGRLCLLSLGQSDDVTHTPAPLFS